MEEIDWYIVFTNYEVQNRWVKYFFKFPFFHCYCFRQIGNSIFYANCNESYIETWVYESLQATSLVNYLLEKPNTKILKYRFVDNKIKMFNVYNMFPTCVTNVKSFLGVRSKAITPYQLYKALLAKGAIKII